MAQNERSEPISKVACAPRLVAANNDDDYMRQKRFVCNKNVSNCNEQVFFWFIRSILTAAAAAIIDRSLLATWNEIIRLNSMSHDFRHWTQIISDIIVNSTHSLAHQMQSLLLLSAHFSFFESTRERWRDEEKKIKQILSAKLTKCVHACSRARAPLNKIDISAPCLVLLSRFGCRWWYTDWADCLRPIKSTSSKRLWNLRRKQMHQPHTKWLMTFNNGTSS